MSGPGYLAFSWPATEEARAAAGAWSEALARAPVWRLAYDGPHVQVWVRGANAPDVAASADGRRVIIGRIFPTPGSDQPHRTEAAGRQLIADHWGSYVVLLRDDAGDPFVLRDPAGALDALVWSCGPIAAVASDLEDLPGGLTPPRLALDWDVIASWFRDASSGGGAPAFEGIASVAPGELRALGPDVSCSRTLWRAADWTQADAPPAAELEPVLRDTLDRVVSAWAAVAGPALLEISGGFDSSVVAAAWSRRAPAGQVLAGLNMFADLPESDERAWATAVADALGYPLVAMEKPLVPWSEADFAELAPSARPPLNALDSVRDRLTANLLAKAGASALVTGQGGDALFFQMPSPLLLADYARGRAPSAWMGRFAQDLASRLRRSVWATARDARRGWPASAALPPLVGPRVRELGAGGVRHPWLEGSEQASPAKRLQLEALAATHLSFGRSRRGAAAELIHPLLSQPMLELALVIPAWRLARDGRERGLARDAFGDGLPPGIGERRSKGALTSFYARQTAASLDFLRPFLLDGVLVEAGVLDRARLEEALTAEHLIWRAGGPPILLRAAAVEAWTRRWQGRAPDSSAAPRTIGARCPSPEARRMPAA